MIMAVLGVFFHVTDLGRPVGRSSCDGAYITRAGHYRCIAVAQYRRTVCAEFGWMSGNIHLFVYPIGYLRNWSFFLLDGTRYRATGTLYIVCCTVHI